MQINTAVLEDLLAPAIEATATYAVQHQLTHEQHADYATAVFLAALDSADRDDPAMAGRLHAALTA